jgi:hypothetical protein
MRPLGFDEGSLHPNMMYPSLCFLLLLLVGWFRLEPPMIGSTSFVAKGATTWLLCEAIVTTVEVSSPEVGANVGPCSRMLHHQEQSNTIVND